MWSLYLCRLMSFSCAWAQGEDSVCDQREANAFGVAEGEEKASKCAGRHVTAWYYAQRQGKHQDQKQCVYAPGSANKACSGLF